MPSSAVLQHLLAHLYLLETTITAMPSVKLLLSAGTAYLITVSGYSYFSNDSWFFEKVLMPLVARTDPERAHQAAVYIASKGWVPKARVEDPPILVSTPVDNIESNVSIITVSIGTGVTVYSIPPPPPRNFIPDSIFYPAG